ncbi:unnamed protein product [Cochlearia groenlandica]
MLRMALNLCASAMPFPLPIHMAPEGFGVYSLSDSWLVLRVPRLYILTLVEGEYFFMAELMDECDSGGRYTSEQSVVEGWNRVNCVNVSRKLWRCLLDG